MSTQPMSVSYKGHWCWMKGEHWLSTLNNVGYDNEIWAAKLKGIPNTYQDSEKVALDNWLLNWNIVLLSKFQGKDKRSDITNFLW